MIVFPASDFATAIIPQDRDGVTMVDARALHGWLKVRRGFAHWLQDRIGDYGFEEGTDFWSNLTKTRGRPRQDYTITVDMAKELSMVERTGRGRQTRSHLMAQIRPSHGK
ncbi:antA/AntB antirepressor family protein [Sphingomonas fennica]|uniref:AntA/AntB antirepressor domain-containing protein n=1 Tax=Edaphosphingomonas fennica TaxID=114404 RepID=A0A2T4I5C5_9SPHN|nr:antA/AntB antirepressor family protein [Sphingomonas fennica]PTD25186.1 hypothetical protein CV103_06380 [Sphingomonas fennica]